jgi:AraC-like DNA-binding protein
MTPPWHRPAPAAAEVETDDDELLTVDKWPRDVFAPHWHEEFNWLVLMRPGRMVVDVEGAEVVLDAGPAAWACILPRTPHAVRHISDDTEVLSCFVPPALMERAWQLLQPRPAPARRVLVGGRAEIARGLALAWGEQRYSERRPDAFDQALGFALAGWLWRVGEAPGQGGNGDASIGLRLRVSLGGLGEQVATFLDAHLAEQPFPWDALAARTSSSVRTLQRRCATALGIPPSELLTRARLERACELLRDPARPLGDVALACGFATQAHFSTVFKARTGASPSQWRRDRVGR